MLSRLAMSNIAALSVADRFAIFSDLEKTGRLAVVKYIEITL